MISLITCLRVFRHIAAFISTSLVILFMAMRVSCRFLSEVFLGSGCFRSRMPLYAVACVKVGNFAPWTSKSFGISRFSGSGIRLFAPSFASASLPSFPWFPSCPLRGGHSVCGLLGLCRTRRLYGLFDSRFVGLCLCSI
jgi:hypothetical protein